MNQTVEHDEKVPGRTVGFTIMTLVILLAAFQMSRESSLQQMQGFRLDRANRPVNGYHAEVQQRHTQELVIKRGRTEIVEQRIEPKDPQPIQQTEQSLA